MLPFFHSCEVYTHISYFRIDVQSSIQFSEYAKSAKLRGGAAPPIPPLPTALHDPVIYVQDGQQRQ